MMAKPRIALMLELGWSYKWHTEIYSGIQNYANEVGWDTVIDEFADESLPLQKGRRAPYDGVIARATNKLVTRAARHQIPVVNVWYSSPAKNKLPGVFPDIQAAGRLRAEHLYSRGFRQFAALGVHSDACKKEIHAYQTWLTEKAVPCLVENVDVNLDKDYACHKQALRRIEKWMDQLELPVGVFVFKDRLGRMVTQMCRNRGWRLPQDVALVTGSNEETFCVRPYPSLTSLDRDYERVGYRAAHVLNKLLNRNKPEERIGAHVFIPPRELIVRESSDHFSVSDERVDRALTFIRNNCHRAIGQDDVADAVDTDTGWLQIRFRKTLDKPIASVIRYLRVEKAKQALVTTDHSIERIARNVGFKEPARMRATFHREVGMSPREYRKRFRRK